MSTGICRGSGGRRQRNRSCKSRARSCSSARILAPLVLVALWCSSSVAVVVSGQNGSRVDESSSIFLGPGELIDSESPALFFEADQANSTSPISPTNATVNTDDTRAAANKTLSPVGASSGQPLEGGDAKASTPTTSDSTNSENDDSPEAEPEEEPPAKGGAAFELPPQNVSQYMDYIEGLFHDLRHQISDLFEPHIPQLIRTSQMVQLSGPCSYDMLRLALALRQFEPWALRIIDSSGKMPEGIFEGSFTALGSYDQCLSTAFLPNARQQQHSATSADETPETTTANGHQQTTPPTASTSQPASNAPAGQQTRGKYCLVNVSPYLPPKPPADRIERVFQEEANRRNYTKDDQLSRLSPMFYYMKFRIGVCIPSTCSETDLGSIASALSASTKLNITIPHCRVNQHQPLTMHQLVGGLIFGSVLALVLLTTLIDCSLDKFGLFAHHDHHHHHHDKLDTPSACERREKGEPFLVLFSPAKDAHLAAAAAATVTVATRKQPIALVEGPGSRALHETDTETGTGAGTETEREPARLAGLASSSVGPFASSSTGRSISLFAQRLTFAERLRANWLWISFSVPVNFRLHFGRAGRLHSEESPASQAGSEPDNANNNNGLMVGCLNGIRVISLCWVIIANSYITLDPRATKRLTKTREVPKDFLFQLVAQASLAIETFFFLSGTLMSISYTQKLASARGPTTRAPDHTTIKPSHDQAARGGTRARRRPQASRLVSWLRFYVHRYVRVTPATMLVIAFTMFAFRFGDGPLWIESTQRAHASCSANWWRHLLHVANFIDTRQMCFIHYWYIAADMQLFLLAPLLMYLLHRWRPLGLAVMGLVGAASIGNVFYTTYARNLPPTLLFYSSDPESRREFGNTIMTKPLTHALPYMVGMLVGMWISASCAPDNWPRPGAKGSSARSPFVARPSSLMSLLGLAAALVALAELFLPYQWNNSHLPTRLQAALYACLFRLAWALVLAYLVVSCRHRRTWRCQAAVARRAAPGCASCGAPQVAITAPQTTTAGSHVASPPPSGTRAHAEARAACCFCPSGGNCLNRLLSLSLFGHLSKLSFVAYLIHLPLMSVFIAQTRGLFAFSHTLVIHLALSYLLMTFILSFVLVHVIEFPFITFERYLFDKLIALLSPPPADRQSGATFGRPPSVASPRAGSPRQPTACHRRRANAAAGF